MDSTESRETARRRPYQSIISRRGWFLSEEYVPEEVEVQLSPLESLPTELLVQIFENLVTVPATLSAKSHQDFNYWSYRWSRKILHNLCKTSRRIASVACPVLYRVLHLTEPYQLVAAWRQIRQHPHLASHVHHIICDINLVNPWIVSKLGNDPLFQFPQSVVKRAEYLRLRGKDTQLWTKRASTSPLQRATFPQRLFFDLLCHTTCLKTLEIKYEELGLTRTTAPFVAQNTQNDHLYFQMISHIAHPSDWCIDRDIRSMPEARLILQQLTLLRLHVKDWGSFAANTWMSLPNLCLRRVEMVGTGRWANEYWNFDLKPANPSDEIQLGNRVDAMQLSEPHMAAVHLFYERYTPAIRSIRFDNPLAKLTEPSQRLFPNHYSFNKLLLFFTRSLEHLHMDCKLNNWIQTWYYTGDANFMDSIFQLRRLKTLTMPLNLLFEDVAILQTSLNPDPDSLTQELSIEEYIGMLLPALTTITIHEWWGYDDPDRDLARDEEVTMLLMKALVKNWLLVAPPGDRMLRLRPRSLFQWVTSGNHIDLQLAFPSLKVETALVEKDEDFHFTFNFTHE